MKAASARLNCRGWRKGSLGTCEIPILLSLLRIEITVVRSAEIVIGSATRSLGFVALA